MAGVFQSRTSHCSRWQPVFNGDCRHTLQERLADSQAAQLRLNKKIFEVQSRPSSPGGVIEKVEGKTGWLAVVFGHQALKIRIWAKTVTLEVGLGGSHGVRLPLVGRQGANQRQNLRYIRFGCGANHSCHAFIVGCDFRKL